MRWVGPPCWSERIEAPTAATATDASILDGRQELAPAQSDTADIDPVT